jgi:hypothetical protein
MELDLFEAIVPLRFVFHIKDLIVSGQFTLTLISLSATSTLSAILFARNTYENFPWPERLEAGVTYRSVSGSQSR